jgi:hypothetical protein
MRLSSIPGRNRMYVPAARERVRVKGHDRLYLVAWVDHERRTADLIPLDQLDGRHQMKEDVPFETLHRITADLYRIESIPFSAVEPLEDDS